jgi:hypothetical protein
VLATHINLRDPFCLGVRWKRYIVDVLSYLNLLREVLFYTLQRSGLNTLEHIARLNPEQLCDDSTDPSHRVAAHTALFKAAVRCAKELCDIDLPSVVFQYHADWHTGEELAMQAVFPHSARVADFAHFIGACARPKSRESADEGVKAFRSGFLKTMRKHLSERSQSVLLPFLENWVYDLRSCPMGLLLRTCLTYVIATL